MPRYGAIASAPGWVALVAKPEKPWAQIVPIAGIALDSEGHPCFLAPLGVEMVPVQQVAQAMLGQVHYLLCWDLLAEDEQDSLLKSTQVYGKAMAIQFGLMGTSQEEV